MERGIKEVRFRESQRAFSLSRGANWANP